MYIFLIIGSLYDLWNQNYNIKGSKYYARIAFGEHENPML